jgi:superfamily II DNA or RNA helicase/HKD family nuclease
MSVLAKKGEKTGISIPYEQYSNMLKHEILMFFSGNIDKKISSNDYDNAVRLTENILNTKYELPLQLSQNNYNNIENFLIVNRKTKFKNFFTYLKEELNNCDSFCFIVSFIKFSGIQLLINTLDELKSRGIKGKIITSVYLNITDPKALRKLMEYDNLEIKVFNNTRESFHTKAYLFYRKEYSSCIIGSSNLSQSALYSGEEWNVRLVKDKYLDIFDQSHEQFEKIWDSNEAVNLSTKFIDMYENFKNNSGNIETFDFKKEEINNEIFKPNKMQTELLEKLKLTREFGNKKGLVVAATGTGKTYLAAMDILQMNPGSFLFIAHREELIHNAYNVFSKILPYDISEYGFLTGSEKTYNKKFMFSTIQSLYKNTEYFSKNSFDYIIIDEFHHSKAATYESVLNYFEPDFLLGLTATPERMDGKDILELCDYNLIGEMGLREALEYDLLSPFHYFGLIDDTVDYKEVPFNNGRYDDKILGEKLSVLKRVDFIHSKIEKIGFDGEKIKAIAFCANIKHAEYMKEQFRLKGYTAESITAHNNQLSRKEKIENFQNGNIEILCVVDIFNEGIDIPDVNLLLFLRPTMSSTIFIQQLGRGLRKIKNKDFVTVLDFIGNHKKDYIITQAFSESTLNEKERLLTEIKNNFSDIPGASYIELDRICQDRIISKIENYNILSKDNIVAEYLEFKNETGRELDIIDFKDNIDLFLRLKNKFGSYVRAQKLIEKLDYHFNCYEEEIFEILEKNFNLNYPYEVLIIWLLNTFESVSVTDVISKFETVFLVKVNKNLQYNLIVRAMKELSESDLFIFDSVNQKLSLKSIDFTSFYKKRLVGLIELFILNFKKKIDINEFNENILVKYNDYSRIELQILLDSNAQKGSWRAGYSVSREHICLFITLNKSLVIKEELKYDNYFHRQDIVQWISQSKTKHESKIGQMYVEHKNLNMKVHIFIRKDPVLENGSAAPFTYLGEADYHSSHGDKPMYILWKLKYPVPNELFIDFTV